jgi:hypothetical protein
MAKTPKWIFFKPIKILLVKTAFYRGLYNYPVHVPRLSSKLAEKGGFYPRGLEAIIKFG